MINCPVCRSFPHNSDVDHIVHTCECGRLTKWDRDNWSFVYECGKGVYMLSDGTMYLYDQQDPVRRSRRQDLVDPDDVDLLVRTIIPIASIDEVMGV